MMVKDKKSLKTSKRRLAEKKSAAELEKITNDEIGVVEKNKKLLDFIDGYNYILN